MSYERKSIHTFASEDSTGLDVIPLGALVSVKSTGQLYQLTDKVGIVAGTTIKDAGYRLAIFNNSLLNSFTKALFYGYPNSGVQNRTTLLSATGTLLQDQAYVAGISGRSELAGANVGINALFYTGANINNNAKMNNATLLSPTGIAVQGDNVVGTARRQTAGVGIGVNALFNGGLDPEQETAYFLDIMTVLSPTATLVQPETNVGVARYALSGARAGSYALFYAGVTTARTNALSIFTSAATLLQANSNVGTARNGLAGATVGANAMFHGGQTTIGTSITTILSPNGSLLQAETSVGYDFYQGAGANVGINALYYGSGSDSYNKLLSPTATLVQAQATVGTGTYTQGSSSLY